MAFDGIFIAKLSQELDAKLKNSRLDKIQQPTKFELLLSFSIRSNNKLLLSANPNNPNCHLSSQKFTNPQTAPRFCMYLRKHLQGARLDSVVNPANERMLIFNFTHTDELSDQHQVKLIVELISKHSNIILVNENNIIMDALLYRDEAGQGTNARSVLPLLPYIAPPKQAKPELKERIQELEKLDSEINPDEDSQEFYPNDSESGSLEFKLAGINSSNKLIAELLNLAAGISPQIVKEILFRAQISPTTTQAELSRSEQKQLIAAALEVLTEARDSTHAYIYPNAKNNTGDYHCVKLTHLGNYLEAQSPSDAVDIVFKRQIELTNLQNMRQKLNNINKKELKHYRRLTDNYWKDIRTNENYADYKKYADLILAQLYSLPAKVPASGQVELIDYYDPELKHLVIDLDPKYDMSKQANLLYKKYNKQKNTYNYALQALESAQNKLNYLESLANLISTAETMDDLEALNEEINSGPLQDIFKTKAKHSSSARNANRSHKKTNPAEKALAPREYISPSGFKILAGRNNVQNDKLTFRQAAKTDYWFHIKSRPGTHLILFVAGQSDKVTAADITTAAEICAWLSLSANEKLMLADVKLTVDFCPVANVHKPKAAAPGHVIYDNYQSIDVKAEPHNDLLQA